MIEICLCTYNPRPKTLGLVLQSIVRQSADAHAFALLLVDNGSSPPLSVALLDPLQSRGIACRVVREEKPGIFHARNRAMLESTQPLILWVDDDTELPPTYVAQCLALADRYPGIGCFGGKLLLGPDCRYPLWTVPIHPWLAVIDRGEDPITNTANHWGPWEPPTAGAVVRRQVIDHYLAFVNHLPLGVSIGQVGDKSLLRGEDSLLMRMACQVGLACSYQPELRLVHHIDNRRFRPTYLLRLFFGYGRSDVLLERILGESLPPLPPRAAWDFFWTTRPRADHPNWGVYLLMKAWNLGFVLERVIHRA